jgi:nitric oxide reductase large subunit
MTTVHPVLLQSKQQDSYQPQAQHSSNVVVFDETINVDEDVTDFFNAHFKSREDLHKIKTILQQQSERGEQLRLRAWSRAIYFNRYNFIHVLARYK